MKIIGDFLDLRAIFFGCTNRMFRSKVIIGGLPI